ncbi:glucosamine-6-phosphate deaminase [Bacillus tianshenii]|nr:glucosamine-6-phosphate deaminase [Bacillus tianshenii]
MELIVSKSINNLNDYSAQLLVSLMQATDGGKIGLATGNTPIGIYQSLVRLHQEGKADFSQTITYNLDEYCGLHKEHPSSFYTFMKQHLFDHVNLKRENIYIPDGEAEDVEEECRRYNSVLQHAGQLDAQILSLGLNGHIGFNEPGEELSPHTHVVTLTEQTREVNASAFSSIDEVPTHAITMGVASILRSKWILFMALGKKKASILKKSLEGPVTTECPASLLQLHPNVTFFLDDEAASELNLESGAYQVRSL